MSYRTEVKSLARLAAEEAFKPLPQQEAAAPPSPMVEMRAPLSTPQLVSPTGRAPRVFRLEPPRRSEIEASSDQMPVGRSSRIRDIKRPGAVTVVYTRPVEAVEVDMKAADPSAGDALTVDGFAGSHGADDAIAYQQVQSRLEELSGLLAAVRKARSFRFMPGA